MQGREGCYAEQSVIGQDIISVYMCLIMQMQYQRFKKGNHVLRFTFFVLSQFAKSAYSVVNT